MGDLISRSALIEQLRAEGNLNYLVKGAIDNAPTAYNVDKVVEQLDKSSDYYECDEQGREHVQMVDLTEAIEIVKAGGVE